MADYGRLSAGGTPPLDPSSGYGKGGISIQSMPMVYHQGSGSLGTSPGTPSLLPHLPCSLHSRQHESPALRCHRLLALMAALGTKASLRSHNQAAAASAKAPGAPRACPTAQSWAAGAQGQGGRAIPQSTA